MPVLVTSSHDAENSFEQMVIVRGHSVEAVRDAIVNYLNENDGEEIEIAAGQYVHVGDSVTDDDFDVVEIDDEYAIFLEAKLGLNFGTGVIDSVLEDML